MSGPLPAWLAPLTVPASWAYGLVIGVRNKRYDRSKIGRIGLPVISVGNITAGGVGKTPFVTHLAEMLRSAGHHPVIAMRGYGPRTPDGEMSDEQAEYAMRLPDTTVIADPNRLGALTLRLPKLPGVDCVLLDDGFQHRRLHRDMDLVLIDATQTLHPRRLLPAGFLREPPASLKRADAVIVTHAESVDDSLAEDVKRYHGKAPLAWSQHIWTGLTVFHEAARDGRTEDPAWLRGHRVLTMLGIGRPQSVIGQLTEYGADMVVNIPARDHQRYKPTRLATVRGLCQGVDAMVVTAKDWVKLRTLIDLSSWPVPIAVPELAIDMFQGAEALRDLVLQTVADRPDS